MAVKKLIVGAITLVALVAVFAFVDLHEIRVVIARADPLALTFASLLILTNILLGFLRFVSVLRVMGFRPAWRELFFAFSVGQVSSLFVLSVVGQSISRAVALAHGGVPFGASIAATYVERLLAAGLLLLLSLAGLLYLFNSIDFEFAKGGAYLLTSIIAMAVVSITVGFVILRTSQLKQTVHKGLVWLGRVWQSAIITLIAHGAMLAAYMVILRNFDYHGEPLELAAALTIVMFTASLPISFAGWGVRELSAATALSAIGCPPATAIAASILIGALTVGFITVVAAIGVLLTRQRFRNLATPSASPAESPGPHWDKLLLDGCALFCLIFVFFQIRIPVGSGLLTMNVADLGAITGLGMVILLVATRRLSIPIPGPLTAVLSIVSAIFVFGIVVAHFEGVLGRWALINRGFGWIVILGYVMTLAAFVHSGGRSAWTLALRTFIAAGMTVCVWQLALLVFSILIHPLPPDILPLPLEGFAGNQNAFVLQLAALALALILMLNDDDRRPAPWSFYLSVGVVVAVLFFAKSRTGFIYLIMIIPLMFLLSRTDYFARSAKTLRHAILMVVGLPAAALLLPYAIYAGTMAFTKISPSVESPVLAGEPSAQSQSQSQSQSDVLGRLTLLDRFGVRLRYADSESERFQTMADGLALWREHPLIGGGLGSFAERRIAAGQFNVIHSTPIWILAEMGLVGLIAFGAASALLIGMAWRYIMRPETYAQGISLGWILLFTAVGALVHDFFFQRVFWLMLGLVCATHPMFVREAHAAR